MNDIAWYRRYSADLDVELRDTRAMYGILDDPEIVIHDLPADFARSSSELRRLGQCRAAIPWHQTASLVSLARRCDVPVHAVLLAAFTALLHRYGCQDTQVVGMVLEEDAGAARVMPVVTSLRGDPTARHYLARLGMELLRAYHGGQDGRTGRERLDTPFWFHAGGARSGDDTGPLAALVRTRSGVKPSVMLAVERAGEEVRVALEYDATLFEHAAMEQLLGRYVLLLDGFIHGQEQPLSALPLITERERALLEDLGRRSAPYPATTIHRMFERRAADRPEATALISDGRTVSYGELNRMANAMARELVALGVTPGTPVGVCMQRSVEMVAALLAVLKAGGAYVAFDPGYPAERLRFQLDDSRVSIVITHAAAGPLDVPSTIKTMVPAPGGDADDLDIEVDAGALAYLCYTSGTTGRPKAAMIPHRGVLRLLHGVDYARLGADETLMHMAPIAFDASTFELWGALLHGGRCVLYPAEPATGAGIARLIRAHGVTTMWLTAALFNAIVDDDPGHLRGLRQLLIGGEALSVAHVRRALESLPDTQLINGYGPTESTTFACCYRIPRPLGDRASVPIGTPIGDTRAYLLDEHLRPVPPGVPGDLYLGGAGLARGYWRRPELTEQAFLANPFEPGPAARMYRTGDRARMLPDGTIEFLGRRDAQVKLRGFRIELGEIESVLREHRDVRDAVALIRTNQVDEKVLVAYVVTSPECRTETLEVFLAERLPPYMIPSRLIRLDSVPRTANGKVDRRRLPEPDWSGQDAGTVWPRTRTEERIAEVWQEVLGLPRVGVHDGFMELGGHSLLATQVIVRLRESFGSDLPLRLVFEARTIAEMARAIDALGSDATQPHDGPTPIPRDQVLPLSFSQERVWFIQEMNSDANAYNFQATLRFTGALQIDVLRRALDEIVSRHEVFRTTYVSHDGKPQQLIHAPAPAHLVVEDLGHLDDEQQRAEVARQLRHELDAPFFLDVLPLIRWKLLRLRPDEHLLIQVEHHLVHDGWSFHVFLGELVALYRAFAAGQPSPLAPLPIQFADFAGWQRAWMQGEHAARQLAYWKDRLHGLPPVWAMPTDRPRPPRQSMKGSVLRLELEPELADAMRELARRHDATLFQVMFAIYASLLYRYTGQEDLCIGTGIANRNRREIEGLIGMVINTIALRLDLSGDPEFAEVLERVKQVTSEGYANQDVPFDQVVDALKVKRSLAYSPVYQTTFSFHDAPMPDLELPGVKLELEEGISNGSAKFDLNVIMMPRAEQSVRLGKRPGRRGLTMLWEYSTDILDEATIRRMVERYQRLASWFAADPRQRVSTAPLLDADERRRVLLDYNRTDRPYAATRCVHELVGEHAARSPGAVLLRDQGRSWTYGDIDGRANQVAHHLRSRSIGTGHLVPVCMDHSAERVIAELAVLRAGAAFVPVDPAYPQERLRRIIEDCGARVVLTRGKDAARLPRGAVEVIQLDDDWAVMSELPSRAPDVAVAPGDLAYAIFTSGSTGRPKGVLVEHRSLLNLIGWHLDAFGVTRDDVTALLAGPAFDASVWELWPSLAAGATVVVTPVEVRTSPEALRDWLIASGVTVTFVPTPVAEHLVSMSWPERVPLRALLTGGDKLNRHPPRPLPFVLYNNYGPTEATVVATSGPVPVDATGLRAPTIGRPIANTQIYILDQHLEPVPEGVPGEIFIAGAGLARGYLGQPAMTAERFVANPFAADPDARMYRTGDRARHLPGGAIEFLGRMDDQVKVRGFRIELGEIDAALGRHALVRSAVTVARHHDVVGTYLVSYVVAPDRPPVAELRDFLGRSLPAYMVPPVFQLLDELPMTPNGKVDAARLPEPDEAGALASEFQAPRTELERVVAEIFGEVLGRSSIGVRDDFFDLGGHSLLAAQIIARIKQRLAAALPLQALFDAPTVAGLCALIDTRHAPVTTQAGIAREASAAELLERIDELSPEQVDALLQQMGAESV